MGTSSARLGPTGRLWRLAKGAATRYLSPDQGGAVDAREVAARYAAALDGEGEPGRTNGLAAFRQNRKVAQNLGAFCSQAASQGWPAALSAWGLKARARLPELAQSLSAALGLPGGGLEAAVAHTVLVRLWLQPAAGALLDVGPETSEPPLEASRLVRSFLAGAFQGRLALDLGESLEAAAPASLRHRRGLREIANYIDHLAETATVRVPAPATPEHWLGLPGWTWTTEVLAGLMLNLKNYRQPENSL
jgi:hypothetical protein